MGNKAKRPGRQPGRQRGDNQKRSTFPNCSTLPEGVQGVGWVEPFEDFTDFVVNDMALPVADILPKWLPGDAVSVVVEKTQIVGFPAHIVRFGRVGPDEARRVMRRGEHVAAVWLADYPNVIILGWNPHVGMGIMNAFLPEGGGVMMQVLTFADYALTASAAARKWAGVQHG